MPAGGFLSLLRHLLRLDGHRSRLIARRRRHGTDGRRHHFLRPPRDFGRLRRLCWLGERRFDVGVRRGGDEGAGPSGTQAEPPAPLVMPEARPLQPNLHADEVLEPEGELAAPPPPPPYPVHGWACPRVGPVTSGDRAYSPGP
jgi:hypothetical protein